MNPTTAIATEAQIGDRMEMVFILRDWESRERGPHRETKMRLETRIQPIGTIAIADGTLKLKIVSGAEATPIRAGARFKVTIERMD